MTGWLAIDKSPRLQRLATTPAGRALLFLLFSWVFLAIYPATDLSGRNTGPQILASALLCSLAGPYRAHMLAATTLLNLLLAPNWFPSFWLEKMVSGTELQASLSWGRPLALLVTLLMSAAAMLVLRRWRNRWPLLLFFSSYALLWGVGFYSQGLLRLAAFLLVWSFGAYLIYLAYALRDQLSPRPSPIWFQLASFHPYFSGTWIPIGLGAANLRNSQSKNAEELAVCQLKGLKLVCYSWLMFKLGDLFLAARAHLGIPEFGALLHAQLAGTALYSRGLCWSSLVISFFEGMVMAICWGNLLVACARLGGFRILQQVYKPLAATSIADYWNRISFYYKQVVVDLFFFPAYVGYFKNYPRVRQGFAILMAAGVGNLVYHWRNLVSVLAREGLARTLWGMQTYCVYCFFLVLGLWISQLQVQQRSRQENLTGRLLALFRIVLFYCLLSIFDEIHTPFTPIDRFGFIGYLVGL
ncbi:hypothetical protein JST97_08215 [bacterium]|nr:hypothetical protein [bacterium]